MPHNDLFFPKSHFLLHCLLDDISLRIPWVVVSKGVVFKKKLAIPAERIQSVQTEQTSEGEDGAAIIATDEAEMLALTAVGEEELALPTITEPNPLTKMSGISV